MEDFVIIKSKENIEDLFLHIKRYLKEEYSTADMIEYVIDNYNRIYIRRKYFEYAVDAISDFIIRNYIFYLIKDYSEENIKDFDLLVYAVKNYKNKKLIRKIKADMSEFSRLFNEINISGYLLFAFRKYEDLISNAICEALCLYNAEEEYNSIITMMSDYVECSYSEIDIIHIIRQPDGSYLYLDKYSEDIKEFYMEYVNDELDYDEYTQEDEMLCILIKLNPEKIYLHLKEQKININFLFTLEEIFGEKIRICTNECDICKS